MALTRIENNQISNAVAGNTELGINGNTKIQQYTISGVQLANSLVYGSTLSVTGNVIGGNLLTGGTISSTSTITGGNIETAGTVSATSNITGGNLVTAGTITATGNISTANYFLGNGALLTGIDAASIQNGTSNVRILAANGNISMDVSGVANVVVVTTTGIETNTVTATGNVTGGNLNTLGLVNTGTLQTSGNAIIGGDLFVNGNTTYINITDLNVEDPIIGLGRGPNNTPLVANDGKDRGEQLWYFDGVEKSAFTGYDNSAGKILVATDVTIANEIVTVNSFGGFVAGDVESATVSATGNVTGGNVITGGVISAAGAITSAATITGGNIATAGTVSATGTVTGGNLATGGTVSATGAITSDATITGGNIATAGTISATGNITGNYILGNGSQLTGIDTNLIKNGNSNVRIVTADGNITMDVNGTSNVVVVTETGILTNTISATGNVTANYFIGNGSQLTGVVASSANAETLTGNFIANNVTGSSLTSVGNLGNLSVVGTTTTGNLATAGTVSATGDVIGGNVLTGGVVSATSTITGGNLATGGTVSATGDVTGGNLTTGGSVSSTGTVTGGNIATGGTISATGTINSDATITGGNIATGGIVSATGEIVGGNIATAGTVSATSTITGGNIATAGEVSAVGSLTGGNIFTGGIVSATSTITGGNIATAGSVSATGEITGGNIATAGTVSATGAITSAATVTGGNLATGGTVSATGAITSDATITGGNIATAGTVSATGNITGDYFLGNGSFLTGIDTNSIKNGTSNVRILTANGNISMDVNGTSNVVVVTDTGINTNTVTATGNVTSGNVLTGGLVSAAGTVTGGNIATAGTVSATGNVTGGNIDTAGAVSATGTVSTVAGVVSPSVTGTGQLSLGAASNVVITAATGNVILGGGLFINNVNDPLQAQDAATKQYVDDAVSAGIHIHTPVYVETPVALPSATYAQGGTTATVTDTIANSTVQFSSAISPQVNDQYWFTNSFNGIVANTPYYVVSAPTTSSAILSLSYNGAPVDTITNGSGLTQALRVNSGVGATLTADANGALTVDGVLVTTAQRVLVHSQVDETENGVYVVTDAGSAGTPWILTRSSDTDRDIPNDNTGLDQGSYFYVQAGDTGAGESYVMTNPAGEFIIGFDNIQFTQFSASQVYTANTAAGLSLIGTVFNAKVDNNTTAFDGQGNIIVKAGANLTTPNIGAATGTSLSATGNLTGGNVLTGGVVSATGNIEGGNITTAGLISATGNITGNYFIGNGSQLTGVVASSANAETLTGSFIANNVTGSSLTSVGNLGNLSVVGTTTTGNLATAGTVSATGDITGGNVATAGTVSATGDITGGNVATAGTVSATSTVTGGNLATGGSVSATGDVTGGNVLTGGIVSATSTITGGNVLTAGEVSAGGSLTGGNIFTGGLVSATSTITGGNLVTGGSVSSTGTVTGGNVLTGGIVSATGAITSDATITGGNVLTGGLLSATGEIVGGNIATAGTISATSTITGGNIITAGVVSATGNISGNYFLGNGSQLTGIDTTLISNGNSNVQVYANGNVAVSVAGTANTVIFSDTGIAALGTITSTSLVYSPSGIFGAPGATTGATVAINATNSVLMPVGNTAQRPTGVTGMLRFNTSIDKLEVYDSNSWEEVGATVFTVIGDDQFAGDGSTVTFVLSSAQTTDSCIVSINGVVQIPVTAYSVSGTTLTFTEAPQPGDDIDVRTITTTTTVTGISNSPGNAAVNVSDTTNIVYVTGQLSVSGGIIGNTGINTTQIINGSSDVNIAAAGGNVTTTVAGGLVQTISAGQVTIDGNLTVTGNATLSGNILGDRIQNGTTSFDIQTASGNANITIGATSNVAVFTTTGLLITGNISATGDIVGQNINSLSDATLKTNVEPIENAGAVVDALEGKGYDWVDGSGHAYGLIAQAVESIVPEAVRTDDNGIKSVNYQMLTPFLIETIKELRRDVAELKAQINK